MLGSRDEGRHLDRSRRYLKRRQIPPGSPTAKCFLAGSDLPILISITGKKFVDFSHDLSLHEMSGI